MTTLAVFQLYRGVAIRRIL